MSQVEYEDVDPQEEENEDEQFVAVEDEPGAGQQDDVDEHEDDEQEEDTRAGHDDDEERRERRREENRTRRQRQKEARDRNERELNFLRKRNEDLERRFSEFEQQTDARMAGNEVNAINSQITRAKTDLTLANQVIAEAVEANNGEGLAEAMDHRDAIRDQLRDLEQAQQYLTQERRAPAQEPPPLDPRHVAHAQQFMVEHDWWDPAGRDNDSRTVLQIDAQLVQEGYNPADAEYWDELRDRVQEQLPNHFDSRSGSRGDEGGDVDQGNGRARQDSRSRGPEFRTGGRERPLKKNEVYISPERKEAMIEAGVWDDPVLRNKMLRSYAKYDEEAAQEQGR